MSHIERASRLISEAMTEIIKEQAESRGQNYPADWVAATDKAWSLLYNARTELIHVDSRAAVY